ncbi:MAG: ankyrin repeat domain-containing protein [Xanthobacteraceae bacterium]
MNYGDVSDLPPELVNTLANVHYRFHELARARMPSTPDSFEAWSRAVARYGTAAKHAPQMVKEAREARSNPEIFRFIVGTMVDIMKYRMDPEFALNRPEAERARHRDPSKVDEITDLSVRMGLTALRPSEPQSRTDREAIITAIRSGDLDSFRRFLEANPSALNAKQPPHGWTVLHDLAALGRETLPVHARMAGELISAGADVNCRNVLGWTPVHLIAMQGQKEACELARILIAHGADVNATANDGISDWEIFWQHGDEIREIFSAASLRGRSS